jgi:hypothetical protein
MIGILLLEEKPEKVFFLSLGPSDQKVFKKSIPPTMRSFLLLFESNQKLEII